MVRILLRFSEEIVEDPIVSQIILDLKIPANILTAHVNNKGGEVLAEVPQEALDTVVRAFREKGVRVSLPKLIEVDADKCISCGSCVSLCPVEAITLDEDSKVIFDQDKCVGSTCSACVDACPMQAIKSIKQTNHELNGNPN
ncbi:MAG: 4Fe-4S dicluster domain-containing protein [Candidatus Bathyarchaeota archaeon]|nr:4Fe-4S dicluster domain-containing protein [Candidatus Bathyarchaeota archaeon]